MTGGSGTILVSSPGKDFSLSKKLGFFLLRDGVRQKEQQKKLKAECRNL
jgi:hypothetical protein